MKKFLHLIFLLCIILAVSAWKYKPKLHKASRKFTVSGTIMQTVSYCGGAAPSRQIQDSSNTPHAIPYAKLFVKSGSSNKQDGRIIQTINADQEGNFKISLPAGKYCMLEEWKAGTFKLPSNDNNHKVDSACYRDLYNSCDFEILVAHKNIHQLKIVFHRTCSYNQPCVSYRGPLPPKSAPLRQ